MLVLRQHTLSQVHWDATGTTLADASTQWYPSDNPVLICLIGTHWITTGSTLETHWLPTIISPAAFKCTLGSKFQAHWITTGSGYGCAHFNQWQVAMKHIHMFIQSVKLVLLIVFLPGEVNSVYWRKYFWYPVMFHNILYWLLVVE